MEINISPGNLNVLPVKIWLLFENIYQHFFPFNLTGTEYSDVCIWCICKNVACILCIWETCLRTFHSTFQYDQQDAVPSYRNCVICVPRYKQDKRECCTAIDTSTAAKERWEGHRMRGRGQHIMHTMHVLHTKHMMHITHVRLWLFQNEPIRCDRPVLRCILSIFWVFSKHWCKGGIFYILFCILLYIVDFGTYQT